MSSKVILKSPQQLQNLKESGKYLTELLELLRDLIGPWVVSMDLEKYAQKYIDSNNLKWAFKWYRGYPGNLCISVNECVVHWEPSDYVLKEWDLLKIDAGITYKNMISDAAFSVLVWWDARNKKAAWLIATTKQALDLWYKQIKKWWNFYNYSVAVFDTMKSKWYNVIKNLSWHWVWTKVHEFPHIYNYPNGELKQIKVSSGMSFALEPITALKSNTVKSIKGKWDLITSNGDLWAQWEYSVIVTENWPEIVAWLL